MYGGQPAAGAAAADGSQARPTGRDLPGRGVGPSGLDYTLGELQQVVRSRKPSAPGKSGVLAAAMKKLRALSLAVLGVP